MFYFGRQNLLTGLAELKREVTEAAVITILIGPFYFKTAKQLYTNATDLSRSSGLCNLIACLLLSHVSSGSRTYFGWRRISLERCSAANISANKRLELPGTTICRGFRRHIEAPVLMWCWCGRLKLKHCLDPYGQLLTLSSQR